MSQAMWHRTVEKHRGLSASGLKSLREAHGASLRRLLCYESFEASRKGLSVPEKKRVLYVGRRDWCRLTGSVQPDIYKSVLKYGYRGTDGNLYKLGKGDRALLARNL